MKFLSPTTSISSLFAVLGLVLGLRKSRFWFVLSTLAGVLLLLYTHHDRCGQAQRRCGARKTDEVEVATAGSSQILDKYTDNSQWQRRHVKEDPGI